MRSIVVLLVGLLAGVIGHGVLTSPPPRTGTNIGNGIKLQPFGDARRISNRGCGGEANNDPGFETPKAVYTPGSFIEVAWDLTIPHEVDNLDTGVRIAIHYADDDSFSRQENILVGCLEGDDGCGDVDNRASAGSLTRLAKLPEVKTCNYCTLQWTWAAKQDGGFYVQCADIAITNDGLMPDFATLAPETDTNNNGLPDGVAGGATNPNDSGGGSSNAGAAVGVTIAVLVLLGIGFYCYKKGGSGAAAGLGRFSSGSKAPGATTAAGGLPPGWTAAVDPSSGRTYYVNAKTGETTWEMPTGGATPALPPPSGGALPAGWQSAVDPASGRTYYVNSVTGATSWELPM